MDYQALKDEIQNDPEALGYAQHLPDDHVTVAVLLNGDDPAGATFYEQIGSSKAARIAAESGAYAAIKADAENASSSTQSKSMAAIDTLRKSGEDFALQLPKMRQMLQDLVDNDVLTAEQRSAFLTASERPASRAEAVLGKGTTIDHTDVTQAFS